MTGRSNHRFERLDAVSAPGAPGRENEDRLRFGAGFGLVIDGATGLGDARLVAEGGSDAAWLAEAAASLLSDGLGAAPDAPRELVRSVNLALRDKLLEAMRARPSEGPRSIEETPGYALPTAAFEAVRLASSPEGDGALLEAFGLGDCTLMLLEEDGGFWRTRGVARERGDEQKAAARLLAETGGLAGGGFLRSPAVLEQLRRNREKHNSPGGWFWTLGVKPESAEHVIAERRPVRQPALALLATDGFADLVDLYGLYDGPALVRAAAEKGLASLLDELRRTEREIDPAGARFPRFKQSDDATALLLRIV